MVTEAYSNPLQTVVDEFKTLSPETSKVLIFRKSGQIVANTKAASDQAKKLISNFTCIASQSQSIGEVECLTIQAGDSQLNITAINDLYLATVSSRATNQEIIKSLTQVVVPTVVHLVDQVASSSSKSEPQQTIHLKETTVEKIVLPIEEIKPKIESISEPQPTFQHFLPKTPVNQFMIEKIGGILVQTDTVRIDNEIITQWSELYDGKQITMVNIEALDGKKTTCKFKPIREAKANSKGIIQVPEKILQTLQTEKGKLIMVKPVIE